MSGMKPDIYKMKKLNTKSNRGEIATALLLLTAIGATGASVYTYKNGNAVKQLSSNQSSMGQQVNQNTQDINYLGNYVSTRPWETQGYQERAEETKPVPAYNWRNKINFGQGGLAPLNK